MPLKKINNRAVKKLSYSAVRGYSLEYFTENMALTCRFVILKVLAYVARLVSLLFGIHPHIQCPGFEHMKVLVLFCCCWRDDDDELT